MPSSVRRKWLLRLLLLAGGLGYALPGWCPPPPGVLLPDYQLFDLGNTTVGDTSRISIAFRLNPRFASIGPFTINANPYFFYYNQEASFSADAARSTCVTGFVFTSTNSCVLTVAFTPRSEGQKYAQWFGLETCQGLSSSCPTLINRGATANFTATGVAPQVPTLSLWAYLILLLLIAGVFVKVYRSHGAP